jgi:hypothetical protein
LRQADVWTQHAQASFAAQNWSQADGEFQQVSAPVCCCCAGCTGRGTATD